MATLEINGKEVEVSDDFLQLSPQEQERTVEEIAQSLGGQEQDGERFPALGRINKGIAESAGGLVDFLNPFDKPHMLNPFPEGTGSAVEGLKAGMRGINAEVAEGAPQTVAEGFFEGTGNAAGALIPLAKGMQVAKQAGGIVGGMADDAYRSLASIGGAATEVVAGGVSEGARQMAADAGAPEWAQNTVAILAPASVLGAGEVIRRTPTAVGLGAAGRKVKAAVAPYTQSGGREVARQRAVALAGGDDRARELGKRIRSNDEFGLSPAQQTGDENMLALEQLARDLDPNLRSRLDGAAARTYEKGEGAIRDLGGDFDDADAFFTSTRREFRRQLEAEAKDRVARAQRTVEVQSPKNTEAENSLAVSRAIDESLAAAKVEETRLWDEVPKGVQVGTSKAKAIAQDWAKKLGRAKADDMPRVARQLLIDEGGYDDRETVQELHNFYSEMREFARNAMAGSNKKATSAKVANEIAEAVLDDLGAVDGTTAIGRKLNTARAYSAEMHETFDRGAVGRLLKRTLDGDTAVDPELSLKRTVGRGGTEADVSARQLESAAVVSPDIQDYIKDRFQRAAVSATGDFNSPSAAKFIRDNEALLKRYPELRGDILDAVNEKDAADAFASRISKRISALENTKSSPVAGILNVGQEKAIQSILAARNPTRAARAIVNEASRDKTGAAMDGVKGAFLNYLMGRSSTVSAAGKVLSGDQIAATMSDPKTLSVLRQVFDEGEMSRIRYVSSAMAKANAAASSQPSIGNNLSGAKANRLIETVARIAAARFGADAGGGGGGSIQTAQMASSRMKGLLERLASDKASEILAHAVEDPDLFKALLMDGRSAVLDERALPRIIPYLVGGGSAAMSEGE